MLRTGVQRFYPFMSDTHVALSVDAWVMVRSYLPNLRKSSPLLSKLIVIDHPGLNPQEKMVLNSRRKTYHNLVAVAKELSHSVHPSKAKRLHRIASMLSK